MTHYYSKNQDELDSKPSSFEIELLNNKLIFNTDIGVFSKNYIDFGTRLLINTYKPNDIDLPILDMGSGLGPIGISISKAYNKKAILAEINERAYNLSILNIKQNNVDAIAYNSYLYDELKDMQFSAVLTNPPIRAGKDVVFAIYDGAYEHLIAGGELWVVIQKKQGMESSLKHIKELFGNANIVSKDKGYYIINAKK